MSGEGEGVTNNASSQCKSQLLADAMDLETMEVPPPASSSCNQGCPLDEWGYSADELLQALEIANSAQLAKKIHQWDELSTPGIMSTGSYNSEYLNVHDNILLICQHIQFFAIDFVDKNNDPLPLNILER